MSGHIRQRGKSGRNWELKFDTGRDPRTGKRRIQYRSFKGGKREAQQKLAELIASVGQGSFVERSRLTVASFVRGRVDQWEAAGNISARTAQRYRQLLDYQIVPHLGGVLLQKLSRLDLEHWHAVLRGAGLAPRTVAHAHRVVGQALTAAELDGLVVKNVAKLQRSPKVPQSEMVIVRDVAALIARLHGESLFVLATAAVCTGMRLGELLALKWSRIHLDRKLIEVR